MYDVGKKVFNYKTNEFLKIYDLSEEAKTYVKEEFKLITNHIMVHQKGVNTKMAKILKQKAEKEEKPAPTPAPVVQPSGSGTLIYEMEHNPMNSYNKVDWKDCKLTMQSTFGVEEEN